MNGSRFRFRFASLDVAVHEVQEGEAESIEYQVSGSIDGQLDQYLSIRRSLVDDLEVVTDV